MKNIKIFKIGGSVLSDPRDFMKVAHRIAKWPASKICLVTSALKGKTGELIDMYHLAVKKTDFWSFERFVGFGEIQSAMLFESAFKSVNCPALAVMPWMKEWPLFVDLKTKALLGREKTNELRNFTILPKSRRIVNKYFLPLFNKYRIVVVPGFVATDQTGHLITLGRGGSDVSAFIFSELTRARELILVKEVNGVLNLDPRLQKKTRVIRTLQAHELGIIASSGAQVLNPVSLKHQKKLGKVKVISIKGGDRPDRGTEIIFRGPVAVQMSKRAFSVLTFVGSGIPETHGILHRISGILSRKNISIFSITISDNLIAIYVDRSRETEAYKYLSPLVDRIRNLRALNLKRDIGKVVVRSVKFINEPGIIKKIVSPLARQGINIWEVLTVHTDVMVFVEHKDVAKTYETIKKTVARNA